MAQTLRTRRCRMPVRGASIPRTFAALSMALELAACAGVQTYPNSDEKNAVVSVTTENGTLLPINRVSLDLYSVDPACRARYLGSMKLLDSSVDIGLPKGERILLAYVFSHTPIIGMEGTTSIEMMITPRQGYRYRFTVVYSKEGYSATGLAFAPGQTQGIELEHERLRECTPRD